MILPDTLGRLYLQWNRGGFEGYVVGTLNPQQRTITNITGKINGESISEYSLRFQGYQ
jgi:hypothetical protein